jgi:RimJ/RimL family protein N-acetyltransferase
MPLSWSYASPNHDRDEYASFTCWDGADGTPWLEEVQTFIRHWVLTRVPYVVSFRAGNGDLVGVGAFEERNIYVPLVEPVQHEGWHLQVVGIRLEDQGKGLSRSVFRGIFEAMRQLDDGRVIYTAHVHKDNVPSIAACARVGLDLLRPKDTHYWILLGEVPIAADEEE